MTTQNILYQRQLTVNDKIRIVIPSVREILEHEDQYYAMVSLITAMPIDMMVMLDDAGIDFSEINEYDLFLLMFPSLKQQDTKLVFGDLDLNKFEMATNEQNGTVVLLDRENDIVIDRSVHGKIAWALRRLHNLEKNIRQPGNNEAKKFMLKRARDKIRRCKNRKKESQLESLIVAMVNTEQFKYNFEQVLDLTIYQFNESVKQIIKKVDYDNKMYGVYTGVINAKDLSQDDFAWWVSHK